MERIIGACGLVCSNCGAYQATQAGDAEAIARVAAEWTKEYGHETKPESVWCDGCMTAGARKCGHWGECDIRACAIERGVENCAGCADYACERIAGFMQNVAEARDTLEALRAQ
jgi:hypothetical protein